MKTIIIRLTDEQDAAKEALLSCVNPGDLSKLIRRLIAEECQRNNIAFPDNMPKPSRKRREKSAS
jgi:hypothetical protein